MVTKPAVKSFLIADQVIQEKVTNKWSAIGIFDHLLAANFPCIHPHVGIYMKLSDAEGEYLIRVEFSDSNNKKLAIFQGIKINVLSRLASPEIGIQTNNLPIPKPGRYSFDLYFNDEFVQSIPLEVMQYGAQKTR